MRTALFLIAPHLSHYYPTFGLAKLLSLQGYKVTYGVTHEFTDINEQEYFDVSIIQYSDEYVIKNFKIFVGLFLKTYFDNTFTRKRYREFLYGMLTVEKMIDRVQPDIVFIEDTLTHYYPVINKTAKVIQLSTRLSSHKRPGIPPLSSFWRPHNFFVDNFIANVLWFKRITEKNFSKFVKKIIFSGYDEDFFQRKYERKVGFTWAGKIEKNMSFYPGLKNFPSIVLAPPEIEFSWRKPIDEEFYLSLSSDRNESKQSSPAYEHFMEDNKIRNKGRTNKLVYVSLGTLLHNNYEQAKIFLTNALKALKSIEGLNAIIVTGGIDLDFISQPNNMCCIPAVPQLELLHYCDLMITHGGLGTVKECLEKGVPMLVYPLNTSSDQPGNSARVVSNGFGLRGRISDSHSSIEQKVRRILRDPKFRDNCIQVSKSIKHQIKNSIVV